MALGRGPALDARYLRLAAALVDRGARLSLATQDPAVLEAAARSGLLDRVEEIEMLHGVRPELLRSYRESGHACRIYATYGENWWLHLLHRLAEHPRWCSPPWPTSPNAVRRRAAPWAPATDARPTGSPPPTT
ncbi:hypothetical protein V6574_14045 [Streptomyces sp. SM1P]